MRLAAPKAPPCPFCGNDEAPPRAWLPDEFGVCQKCHKLVIFDFNTKTLRDPTATERAVWKRHEALKQKDKH